MKNNKTLFIIVGILILGGLFFAFKPTTQNAPSSSEPGAVMEREEETEEVKDFTAEKEVNVEIINYKYVPAKIRIKNGTKVTWTNRDIVRHNAASDDGSFKTELLKKDESASVVFEKNGNFGYYCTPHPFMRGAVIVE